MKKENRAKDLERLGLRYADQRNVRLNSNSENIVQAQNEARKMSIPNKHSERIVMLGSKTRQ